MPFNPDPTTCYKWTIHDQNACPSCKDLNGLVRSFQYWSFMPARHDNCRCTLKPVEENEDGFISDSLFPLLPMYLIFNLDGSISLTLNAPEPDILDPFDPHSWM